MKVSFWAYSIIYKFIYYTIEDFCAPETLMTLNDTLS